MVRDAKTGKKTIKKSKEMIVVKNIKIFTSRLKRLHSADFRVSGSILFLTYVRVTQMFAL